MRLLQTQNDVTCIRDSLNEKKYECEGDIINQHIKNIMFNSINFGSQNVSLIISPLALKHKDNLQNVPDSYDDLFDKSNIFVLQNSQLEQKRKLFNVSGIMNEDPQLPIDKEITLLVKSENEQQTKEISCLVIDNNLTNYMLNCKVIENTFTYDLNNSMSIMDNNLLLINFEEGSSIIENTSISSSNRNYYFKSSSGISSGGIAAIVLVPIIVLALVMAIIYFSKKNSINKPNSVHDTSSTKFALKRPI